MRVLKMFLTAVIVLGLLIFLLSLLFPSVARLERSGSIDAPVSTVFAQVSDLKTWPAWNPWDPAYRTGGASMQQYSDPAEGKGAWFTWSNTAGRTASGRVEIVLADPEKGITYNMTHPAMKPVTGVIELKPTADGKGTAILWRLETQVGMAPWWKLRGFLMDRMFGESMEEGLSKLKMLSEKY
ncbi:SRPBCC family protein [Chitinophaga sp. XS-30]|uniref:SRPBCC family protein n=1 Tax=Chitinophaga sp. XS-30 TaxID=2604421 RepID=UPI0011DE00BA|nr:SRPBCC family protein [Chitinophaga sp. XS-30]QEH43095.1 hypothetical protein FW415_20375 [Chitinophaga sp. XS-30]